ncbi:hypothetical protein TIFTF001_047608 [Ficus carica]|uniref:Uncharacterized protein n=1 Tax=Ficus carica TaxID=3494 RepID=A0AA87Z4E3_FICCA|nr:hypothetical protein TIFTF001_047608 [Ficus carica]
MFHSQWQKKDASWKDLEKIFFTWIGDVLETFLRVLVWRLSTSEVLVLILLCNGSRLKQACILKVLGFESTFVVGFHHSSARFISRCRALSVEKIPLQGFIQLRSPKGKCVGYGIPNRALSALNSYWSRSFHWGGSKSVLTSRKTYIWECYPLYSAGSKTRQRSETKHESSIPLTIRLETPILFQWERGSMTPAKGTSGKALKGKCIA